MRTVSLSELGLPTQFPLPSRRAWRIGVIGLGGISHVHLPAYASAGWSVVAAADLDEGRRRTAQEEFLIPDVAADYRAVINHPSVDVVALLTQPTVREEVVRACAEAGKSVLVEKPIALDVATAERMVAIADAAGIQLAVSQNYRWLPPVFIARALIEAGWIGRPYFASIELHGTQDRQLADHPFYSRCTDFLTVQWNSHLADLLRSLMGRDPERVLARTSRMPGQSFVSDNLLTSLVDFGREGTGLIIHNELHRGGLSSDRLRIDGDAGTLSFSLWGPHLILRSDRLGDEPVTLDCAPDNFLSSFCGPMSDLLCALESGSEPSISGRRNLATIRQILAEHETATAGDGWRPLPADTPVASA